MTAGYIRSMPSAEPASPKPIRPSWTTLLGVLTAFVGLGTVTLHVMGMASHRAYMQFWGIDSGVLPKTTDQVLITGYYALVNQSAMGFLKILANIGLWTVAAVGLAVYLFILQSPWDGGIGSVLNRLAKRPVWVQRLARYVVGAVMAAAILPILLVSFVAVMSLPDALGGASGKTHAEREARDFKQGCEKSKQPCVELKKSGESIGTGFVLDGSPGHIAIFDAKLQRARVIPREAVELIAGRAPVPFAFEAP